MTSPPLRRLVSRMDEAELRSVVSITHPKLEYMPIACRNLPMLRGVAHCRLCVLGSSKNGTIHTLPACNLLSSDSASM